MKTNKSPYPHIAKIKSGYASCPFMPQILLDLWNRFCEQKSFCLFCAYPKSGFTDDINTSIIHICGTHSKMIAGSEKQLTEVYYRDIEKVAHPTVIKFDTV